MSTFYAAYAAVQTAVAPLLLDRRVQAVAALALVAAMLLLSGDSASAAPGVISGGGHRPR